MELLNQVTARRNSETATTEKQEGTPLSSITQEGPKKGGK
jgi:hypothetical protein